MNYQNELDEIKQAKKLALMRARKLALRQEGERRFQTFLNASGSILKIHTQNSFNLRYDGPSERAWFGEGRFEPINDKIELPENHHPLDGPGLEFHLETGFGVDPNHCENDDIIDINYRPKTDSFMVYFRCNDTIYGRERLAKFCSKYKIKLDPSPIEEFRTKTYDYITAQIEMVHQLNQQSGCE
jgi:hypothetical protein